MERPSSIQGEGTARTNWERFAASGKISDYIEYKKTADAKNPVSRQ